MKLKQGQNRNTDLNKVSFVLWIFSNHLLTISIKRIHLYRFWNHFKTSISVFFIQILNKSDLQSDNLWKDIPKVCKIVKDFLNGCRWFFGLENRLTGEAVSERLHINILFCIKIIYRHGKNYMLLENNINICLACK